MTIKAFINSEEKKRVKEVEPAVPVAEPLPPEASPTIEQTGGAMPAGEQEEIGNAENNIGDAVSLRMELSSAEY